MSKFDPYEVILDRDFDLFQAAVLVYKATEGRLRHIQLKERFVVPNMAQINQRTGQENDPDFMAYSLEFFIQHNI